MLLCSRSCRLLSSISSRSFFKLFGDPALDKYNNPSAVAIIKNPDLPAIAGKPRLNELSLKGIAEYMNTDQCQNILVLSGHGLSTAAGIPDYRKVGGIEARKLVGDKGYDEKKDAEMLFYNIYYYTRPYGFFRFMQYLWPGNFRPTLSHYFVRTLQDKGMLLRQWTENLDNLEKLCGIREEKLVEFYGSWMTFRCDNNVCDMRYNLEWIKEKLDLYQLPICDNCFYKTRPCIQFHEEPVCFEYYQASVDAANADLVIVLGSDLQLSPFCSIPHMVPWDVPRLVINSKPVENDTDIWDTEVLYDFDSDAAYRDVFWEGSTDLGVLSLCSYLGWDREVREVMNSDTLHMPTRKDVQKRLGMGKPVNHFGMGNTS